MFFDCQKNMTLPKLLNQSKHFSRQIYFYYFTVFLGTSGSALKNGKMFVLYLNETERPKVLNEITNGVYYCLQNTTKHDRVHTIRMSKNGNGGGAEQKQYNDWNVK